MTDSTIQPPAQPMAPLTLPSFGTGLRIAIIGASGGIGAALAHDLAASPSVETLFRLSRSAPKNGNDSQAGLHLDLEDEESIASAAASIRSEVTSLDLVFVTTGLLHEGSALQPEKTLRALSGEQMARTFQINTIGPALVAKHFLPLLARDRKAAYAALSARVGSITDNRLGGWHAYRASKAALNMMIRTMSIELVRLKPMALCVGLHPGTVDTDLSKPFQSRVAPEKLFTPAHSARCMLSVLDRLGPEANGGVFAWDGARIPA